MIQTGTKVTQTETVQVPQLYNSSLIIKKLNVLSATEQYNVSIKALFCTVMFFVTSIFFPDLAFISVCFEIEHILL